jgi:hypothetical protein
LKNLDLPEEVKFRIRAKGGDLSAEDVRRIYDYILGMLFFQYADSKQFQGDAVQRSLCYMVAYNYLNQRHYPSLANKPFLNPTLNLYGPYYLYKLCLKLDPLLGQIKGDKSAMARDMEALKRREETAGDRESMRITYDQARIYFQASLIEFRHEIKRTIRDQASRFINYYDNQYLKSNYVEEIDEKTRTELAQMRKEFDEVKVEDTRNVF